MKNNKELLKMIQKIEKKVPNKKIPKNNLAIFRLTKIELIEMLVHQNQMTPTEVEKFYDSLVQIYHLLLKKYDMVYFPLFGKFKVSYQAAKTIQSNDFAYMKKHKKNRRIKVHVPESYNIRFSVSKRLKRIINKQ